MAISKMTDDLNIISSLPDRPTLTSQELKGQFDKASNLIKKYLNEKLTEEVATELETTKNEASKNLNAKVKEIEESVESTINELREEIEKNITSQLNGKTQYEDFVIETKSIYYSCTQSQQQSLSATYTKEGYKPLGLVGHYYTNLYEGWAQGAYAENINDTSITVKGFVARGNTGGTTQGYLNLNILWVKKS